MKRARQVNIQLFFGLSTLCRRSFGSLERASPPGSEADVSSIRTRGEDHTALPGVKTSGFAITGRAFLLAAAFVLNSRSCEWKRHQKPGIGWRTGKDEKHQSAQKQPVRTSAAVRSKEGAR